MTFACFLPNVLILTSGEYKKVLSGQKSVLQALSLPKIPFMSFVLLS